MLFLLEDHRVPEANTIFEHQRAFDRYAAMPVYAVNVALGFPQAFRDIEFAVTVFHYSLRPTGTWITTDIDAYLKRATRTYKVAIFQDEIWYFKERLEFLNRYAIDCLYTRHKPKHWDEVYHGATALKKRVFYMAGYVATDMVDSARKLYLPQEARPIDVGYRGRRLPHYLGRGAQEKSEIGEKFLAHANDSGLKLDIAVDESQRCYGAAWYHFLAKSKAVLGVEGGATVIDLEDRFRPKYYELIKETPNLTFDDFAERVGEDFLKLENRIDYRAFTPRHFEAAAFRNVQVLFEGHYDGLLTPNVHYVPLRKDFSNVAEVLAQLRDPVRTAALTEQAYEDLIASGRYSYERFIRSFDEELAQAGVRLEKPDPALAARLQIYLDDWATFREGCVRIDNAINEAYRQHPHNLDNLLLAREMMQCYAANRPFYPLTGNVHPSPMDMQAQDQAFFDRLCLIARCDLDVGAYKPSMLDLLKYMVADSLSFAWRALRKLGRLGRSVATGWRTEA